MRHKYETRGLVLARAPVGEAHALLAVLTPDVGLVWARATGLRHAKSKLAHALVTFAESDVTLVRGREGWRVTGAVLRENWFVCLPSIEARSRAARITGLLLRLSPAEQPEHAPFALVTAFLAALCEEEATFHESAELAAAATLLAALGFDTEPAVDSGTPGGQLFSREHLAQVEHARDHYIARINRGIAASGL
jgi:recombinational DNA repair protein (RecF pathway)